jgi:hypothetical protein
MVAIDSDVILIDCRYQRDPNYVAHRRFLAELAARQIDRATTLPGMPGISPGAPAGR